MSTKPLPPSPPTPRERVEKDGNVKPDPTYHKPAPPPPPPPAPKK